MLDLCVEKKSQHVTTIELRGEKDTRYVTEDDIICSKASGNYIHLILKDGSAIEVLSSVDNFYAQLEAYTHYLTISPKAMVNMAHVKKLGLLKITMNDGTTLPVAPNYYSDVKTAIQNF